VHGVKVQILKHLLFAGKMSNFKTSFLSDEAPVCLLILINRRFVVFTSERKRSASPGCSNAGDKGGYCDHAPVG
jgi:hypothetical protein